MRAIQVSRFGGPDVLEQAELAEPLPGSDDILVAVKVAGVNFRDLLHRSGAFGATLPYVPGCEGAGEVVAVGDQVRHFRAGQRVAYKLGSSYAEFCVVKESEAVAVPEEISDEQAAAVLLQGLTAHFLITTSFPVSAGRVALVHAAAGGVGHLLCQMISHKGAKVIATVSSAAKGDVARSCGAAEVLVYGESLDLVGAVMDLTAGRGVDVVFDGVGAPTFDASLACCATRASLMLYGASGGAVAPVDPMRLMQQGSIVLSRPSVRDFTAARQELDHRAGELFAWVASGTLLPRIGARFDLAQAPEAHRQLEQRRSVGKLVLEI